MGILDFLVPHEEKFFDMLCDQAANTLEGAIVFREFMLSYGRLDKRERDRFVDRIKIIEAYGDRIIHAINIRLNDTLITPIDKEDIHEIASLLDDVLDFLDKVSQQMVAYNVRKVDPYIIKLADCIVAGMQFMQRIMGDLRRLKFPSETANRIREIESNADDLYCEAMARLFSKNHDAIEVVKLKDIYQALEIVTDKIKDVTGIIESVVIKHA
jgi:uncharacterized protein